MGSGFLSLQIKLNAELKQRLILSFIRLHYSMICKINPVDPHPNPNPNPNPKPQLWYHTQPFLSIISQATFILNRLP